MSDEQRPKNRALKAIYDRFIRDDPEAMVALDRARAEAYEVEPPGEKYLALIHDHPLRPIKGDGEFLHAVDLLDLMLDTENLAPEEDDYLCILGDLIGDYEDKHHPMPEASKGTKIVESLRRLASHLKRGIADKTHRITVWVENLPPGAVISDKPLRRPNRSRPLDTKETNEDQT